MRSLLVLNKTYFVSSLRKKGFDVVIALPDTERFESFEEDKRGNDEKENFFYPSGITFPQLISRLPQGWRPDVVIYHDDSAPIPHVTGFEDCGVPTLFFSVDAHLHPHSHPQISGVFDRSLVAQRDFVSSFRKYNEQSDFFPLWARNEGIEGLRRGIDISFRGSLDPAIHPGRAAFFEKFRARVPIDAALGPYRECYSQSKIVVNHAVLRDLNFRVFEILSCGALALTPDIDNGLRELFTPGTHLVTYKDGDPQDAAEKALWYLKNPNEREAIARAGCALVKRLHTEEVRSGEFVTIVNNLTLSKKPLRNFSAAYAALASARTSLKALGPVGATKKEFERAGGLFLRSIQNREKLDEEIGVLSFSCMNGLRECGEVKIAAEIKNILG